MRSTAARRVLGRGVMVWEWGRAGGPCSSHSPFTGSGKVLTKVEVEVDRAGWCLATVAVVLAA